MDNNDKIKELTDMLEDGLNSVLDSDNYKKYLSVISNFHNYSINNTILIYMQRPGATLVAGFNAWKSKFNRFVNSGEKGIRIFAPCSYKRKFVVDKKDENGNTVFNEKGEPVKEIVKKDFVSFKTTSVFDISQTSGDELPSLCKNLEGNVTDYYMLVDALISASPVPVEFSSIERSTNGYFSLTEGKIVVDNSLSELQTIKTLIHEIAHSLLHGNLNLIDIENQENKSKEQKETEAESVAFVVSNYLGLDTSEYSFEYLASWSGGDNDTLKKCLETIRKTSSALIDAIEGRYVFIN